jgi:hypothetical protein
MKKIGDVIRCIDNSNGKYRLTINKYYKIEDTTPNVYWIRDDTNSRAFFYSYRFDDESIPKELL